jgi:hypothetical protein
MHASEPNAELRRRCRDCHQLFTVSPGEIRFMQRRDLALPKRCPRCRDAARLKRESEMINAR